MVIVKIDETNIEDAACNHAVAERNRICLTLKLTITRKRVNVN